MSLVALGPLTQLCGRHRQREGRRHRGRDLRARYDPHPTDDFGWNWFPTLDELGRPYCSVTLPNHAMTDTQVSAEYVVNAIVPSTR